MTAQNHQQEVWKPSVLLALYGIDAFNDRAHCFLEQCFNDYPAFVKQVTEFEAVVGELEAAIAEIPYSTPQSQMASDLKHRLFQQIAGMRAEKFLATAVTAVHPSRSPLTPPTWLVRAAESTWDPNPDVDVTMGPRYVDQPHRRITSLIRMEAGGQYPLHRHWGAEELFMLAGDLVIADAVYHAGDYIYAEIGSTHSLFSSTGCTVLDRSCLDDEFLVPLH